MKEMNPGEQKSGLAESEADTEMDTSPDTNPTEATASPTRNSSTLDPSDKHQCTSHQSNNTMQTEISFIPTLGDFEVIPSEIFEIILGFVSVKDISMMSMTSKIINSCVINYISSPPGNKRLFPRDFHNHELSDCTRSSILEHYGSLGLLFKRCTLLRPTKERLKYIHKILSEISCFKFNGCSDPLHCFGLQCYGVFLQTLTAGWDECECHRVYSFLCEVTNLPQKMEKVFNSKPGRFRKLELRIRTFCRGVFLNHWIDRNDSAFWLRCILNPWPMVNQARLLYLIFGPVSTLDGYVAWQNMIQHEADENSLKELAEAVKLLHYTLANESLENDVVMLLEQLTVIPQEWHLENIARFLILCESNICVSFMVNKAVNGQAMELARLVVFLALVCEKDIYCMDWAVQTMQKVCNIINSAHEKNVFLQNIENTFAQMIMDALQFVISGEHDDEETVFLYLFHLVNAQANFHKEILYLTMNYEM
ncbi:F-box only protein 47 [Notechis scutatus]|uniref:F-box only protein 47 n=1 Tax=Notechis scutatus TaxID=8663 RepID=A0A6J1U4U9_9SAUR|nr:F-box only protein 47 [Notechis scutatus]